MQAAYDSGVTQCTPPEMPTKQVYMLRYITLSIFLVAICVFLIIVLIGGMEANLDQTASIILVSVTLICILLALVLSFIAFQRVVQGDEETRVLLPAWDQAMEKWRSHYYCSRDNVVFNPQTNKVLSKEEVGSLRQLVEQEAVTQSAAMASH
jgi:hypothetical protein